MGDSLERLEKLRLLGLGLLPEPEPEPIGWAFEPVALPEFTIDEAKIDKMLCKLAISEKQTSPKSTRRRP